MKRLLFLLFTGLPFFAYAQKIYFPAVSYADTNNYPVAVASLADRTTLVYKNADKNSYYDVMFRLAFARRDYVSVIKHLDSIDIVSGIEKYRYKAAGFHYRLYSLATLSSGKGSDNFPTAFENAFNSLYYSFPGNEQDFVRSYYDGEENDDDKKTLHSLLAKQKATGSDSIDIADALAIIRFYNYTEVYGKTLSLARKKFASIDAYELANRENKLLGLDEGAIVSPTAKTFISNVTVVDVEKQVLVPNVTVGITGNMITSIDIKPKFLIPNTATVIDGSGQYLLPGMTDAHIHFFQSGGLYTRPDGIDLRKNMPYEKEREWNRLNMKDVLKRYIQAGVTSVIDVGSTYNFLQLRDKYRDKSFGPAVFMSGPLITTYEPDVFKGLGNDEPFILVNNEEGARKGVQQQLPYHPDFIKIWYILDNGVDKEISARKYVPIIKATIEEAHLNKLKVAVHATERIAAQLAVENGCDYLVHSVDDEVLPDSFIQLLKAKNVILCPTLIVAGGYRKTFGQELEFSLRELTQSNPEQLGSLYDLKHISGNKLIELYKTGTRSNKAAYKKEDSICAVNLKKLFDAGVRIAAGTDAGNIGTLHGTSYLNELQAMKSAGLTNWQVLRSATINPAFILNKQNETGSIAINKTADLVLLKANPIDDLNNLDKIRLVINKGHLIDPDTLIKETPLALVQRQLNAYNARNLEAFLEPYAEDVELYMFPDKLQYKGKEEMRKNYAFLNTVPDLHCEITERIIQGNTIIDKESVTGFGPKAVSATAIYQVEKNKIKRVYFLR